jgi:Effector protein
VSNKELKATGQPFDHDGDPKTPMEQPGRYTENLIRQRLGLPIRSYKPPKD